MQNIQRILHFDGYEFCWRERTAGGLKQISELEPHSALERRLIRPRFDLGAIALSRSDVTAITGSYRK